MVEIRFYEIIFGVQYFTDNSDIVVDDWGIYINQDWFDLIMDVDLIMDGCV